MTPTDYNKSRWLWLWGLFYGLVITWCGLAATGGGHGSGLLLLLSSAPLFYIAGLYGTLASPILWALIGFLLMGVKQGWLKLSLIFILVVHYTSIIALLIQFDDWEYVSKALFWLVPGILMYIIGQVVMWHIFLTIRKLRDAGD